MTPMQFFRQLIQKRYFLWVLLGLPFLYTTINYIQGNLFYGEVIHLSGELSARLLIIALLATPLQLMFPAKVFPRWLIRNRRYIGVACFAYAALHTVIYLDNSQSWPGVVEEARLADFWTGWVSMVVLLLLALTSNDRSVRWLKRSWKRLHRLVYPAAILLFAHWILVAFNRGPAVAHLALLAVFEVYRLWKTRQLATSRIKAKSH